MKTQEIKSWRKSNEVLIEPLTVDELNELSNNGVITAKVLVDFDLVVQGDIENLNDTVSNFITGSDIGLSDISYSVAGNKGEDLILKVTGMVNFEYL